MPNCYDPSNSEDIFTPYAGIKNMPGITRKLKGAIIGKQ